METSLFLAKVVGLSLAISTLAIIVRHKMFKEVIEQASKSFLTICLSGFTFIILGALLISSHNIWTLDWRVIITVIGWALLLKGSLRIFFPELVLNLLAQKKNTSLFMFAELLVFLASLYLLYQGYFVY